jgi:ribosomal protein S27E
MSEFSYRWYQYRLQVDCDKCGNPVVFQHLEGSPECENCGETSKHTWAEAMDFCGLEELGRGEAGSRQLMGLMTAASVSDEVAEIHCHHCEKPIHPNVDVIAGQDYCCESCQRTLTFQFIPSTKNLVFYRFVNPGNTSSTSLIAVRCISCGAPLDVNPGKANFECSFCKVQNILPVSLRQKTVLDDIYIGVQKKIFSVAELMETDNPAMVIDGLRAHHASAFPPNGLDAVMLKFIQNDAIYNLMLHKTGHVFSRQVLEKIWQQSTSSSMIESAGSKLGKSGQDIANQQNRFSKNVVQKSQSSQPTFAQRIKSLFLR